VRLYVTNHELCDTVEQSIQPEHEQGLCIERDLGLGDLCEQRQRARCGAFVERNQDVAAEVAGGFAPATPFGAWFRNLSIRMLPYLPWKNLVLKLSMRSVERASNALSLEEAWGHGPLGHGELAEASVDRRAGDRG